MALQFDPLPQGFGAEVTGLDPAHVASQDEIATLQAAFAEHHLLVIRDCGRLSHIRQNEITGWFGKCEEVGDEPMTMDNAMDRGRAVLPFHCDITYFPYPFEGISLHTLELPRVPTTTLFVSNAVAWDTLPEALRQDLSGCKARHFYEDDGKMQTPVTVFEYWHPVRLPHYRSGRPLLFVTEHHVEEIQGYSREESAALLGRLFAHLYAPERCYEHVWREGDLLVWDNYAIQHARPHEAHPDDGRRLLQRCSFGEHGFADQLDDLCRAAGVAA